MLEKAIICDLYLLTDIISTCAPSLTGNSFQVNDSACEIPVAVRAKQKIEGPFKDQAESTGQCSSVYCINESHLELLNYKARHDTQRILTK